jgi:hypothetical protein
VKAKVTSSGFNCNSLLHFSFHIRFRSFPRSGQSPDHRSSTTIYNELGSRISVSLGSPPLDVIFVWENSSTTYSCGRITRRYFPVKEYFLYSYSSSPSPLPRLSSNELTGRGTVFFLLSRKHVFKGIQTSPASLFVAG